jgi:cyclopropane-fatty-acyl-phospholipid synthase
MSPSPNAPSVPCRRSPARPAPHPSTVGAATGRARESLAFRAVLRSFAAMTRGHLRLELPDHSVREFGSTAEAAGLSLPAGVAPFAQIRVRREDFFRRCFWSGDIGFAESYIDGDWETDDLTAVIGWFILNVDQAPTLSGSRQARDLGLNLLRAANRLRHALRPNTPANARRHIEQHYDLSNDFFQLILGPSMMYSSALWPAASPDLSFEDAQREKNDRLCRSLRLTAADHVLEIGSGWGGWSLHAARHYGCRVTTVTISKAQYEFARRRIVDAGLAGRVDLQLRDYRELQGRYDKIVSIEMMEAIGHDYLDAFSSVIDRVLKPDGLVALQFITCPDARYDRLRQGVDFIQKHIFPGSLLLSLNRVNDRLSQAGGFVLNDVKDFGPDYARTLRQWHDNFQSRLAEVRALGFDERFLRKWSYYFCYCEAAFALRNISVVQTLHTRPNNLSL